MSTHSWLDVIGYSVGLWAIGLSGATVAADRMTRTRALRRAYRSLVTSLVQLGGERRQGRAHGIADQRNLEA